MGGLDIINLSQADRADRGRNIRAILPFTDGGNDNILKPHGFFVELEFDGRCPAGGDSDGLRRSLISHEPRA
jgi:hypothetical protein